MCYENMGMGCVANHNELLETAVLIVHFQTTHIEPDKEDLHISIQGDNKSIIIITIEEHLPMSTALVSGIFNNDLSRCPLLLLLFTDISQKLRAHLTGQISRSSTVISYESVLGVGPGDGYARPLPPLTEPAPCVICVAPAVTDAAQMSFFESHMSRGRALW